MFYINLNRHVCVQQRFEDDQGPIVVAKHARWEGKLDDNASSCIQPEILEVDIHVQSK